MPRAASWTRPRGPRPKKPGGSFSGPPGTRVPSAVASLERDLEACWTSYRFPVSHWKRIRTTNVLEGSVREVRRRVRDIGRFQDEHRTLAMVPALLDEARAGWRRLAMSVEAQQLLRSLRVQQQTEGP